MARARMILQRLLRPPRWAMIAIPPLSFVALIYLLAVQNTQSASAYAIYGILIAAVMLLRGRKNRREEIAR